MATRKNNNSPKTAGRRKSPRTGRKSPALKASPSPQPSAPPRERRLMLPLIRATFIHQITLHGSGQARPERIRNVGPAGASEEEGNKYLVTKLWSDGLFVYITSEKYEPKAVPCTNVMDVDPLSGVTPEEIYIFEDEAAAILKANPLMACAGGPEGNGSASNGQTGDPDSGGGDEKEDMASLAEDHAHAISQSGTGAPPQEVTTEAADPDAVPDYIINDPSDFLPNDTIERWLQGEMAEMPPGEYIVVNFNHETSVLRLQSADLTYYPIKIPESIF